ncbi:PREDICTED: uncharacterized protein LOC105150952 [Acromyrmex echinatior]|uniref:Uncharacterized protein n=1 Tax=Acromyrmex echinatior TaxID=103372 RepID=F4WZF6_ACREC|nr:PREDICTED: uncharacterized protein LOC105150952 [Acromyrmex echinatior]EGI60400.1 hypothetical protein G5I_11378 [Acromyrmex echinatior]
MFTKHIKIAQLLLLYCVIVQSYVATENRLQQDANFFQDLCNNITNNNDNKEGKNGLTEYNLLPFFLFSYKWNVSDVYLSKSSVEGRTFNEHPLEDQPSVPVEKSDNKVKGRKINVNVLIKRIKLIVTYIKKFQKDATSAVINTLENFKEDDFDENLLLTFVMMIHQWTSDVIVLNNIGKSYYEKILMLPKRCTPHLAQTNYALQDRIIMSSDIISIIKIIHNQLHTRKSKELLEEKSHTMKRNSTAEQLIKLIKSIVFELNEKLNSEETIISSRLNEDIVKLQLFSYKWVFNIRYPNIRTKFVNENSQSSLKNQSSLPINMTDKHDNEPTDQQKNATDVLKREGRSLTIDGKTIDDSTKMVCKFRQTIHHSLEMQLYIFGRITHQWVSYKDYTTEGRSLNDFQLPLEDESFSLPVEESGCELEDDEITIKDFMDDVKLTKHQINENLKIFEETMNTDNESSQKLRNAREYIHVKRSNVESINELLNYLRLKYILTIYRWISNIIIYNTIGKTSLSHIFPYLRKCQPMFPVKETNEQLKEFEEISDEIIYLAQLLQIASTI